MIQQHSMCIPLIQKTASVRVFCWLFGDAALDSVRDDLAYFQPLDPPPTLLTPFHHYIPIQPSNFDPKTPPYTLIQKKAPSQASTSPTPQPLHPSKISPKDPTLATTLTPLPVSFKNPHLKNNLNLNPFTLPKNLQLPKTSTFSFQTPTPENRQGHPYRIFNKQYNYNKIILHNFL